MFCRRMEKRRVSCFSLALLLGRYRAAGLSWAGTFVPEQRFWAMFCERDSDSGKIFLNRSCSLSTRPLECKSLRTGCCCIFLTTTWVVWGHRFDVRTTSWPHSVFHIWTQPLTSRSTRGVLILICVPDSATWTWKAIGSRVFLETGRCFVLLVATQVVWNHFRTGFSLVCKRIWLTYS